MRPLESVARGLRQRGSSYRCCLPALAGFACPQSASPDDSKIMTNLLQNSTLVVQILQPLLEHPACKTPQGEDDRGMCEATVEVFEFPVVFR